MKGKINRGGGFGGAVRYCLEKDGARLIGGTMSGLDSKSITREFGITKALRHAKNPVWHCSLSLPAGERLSDEKWSELAHDFMQRMGYDPGKNQFMIARHADTDHDHIHIVASRIGLDGKLWLGRHDVKQMIKQTQQIEQDYNLTLTPGLEYGEAHKTGLTQGEIEKALKTGEAPVKLVLQDAIDTALQDSPDVAAFLERLEDAGINVRPNLAKTGLCSGLSFELAGTIFKASQLGKKYGFGQLQKRGLDYDQERDLAALQAAAKRRFDDEDSVSAGPGKKSQAPDRRTLDRAFTADSAGVYRWGNHKTVAFVDHGDDIDCRSSSATALKGVVQLAQQKGWDTVTLKTLDRAMAAEFYRQARLAGFSKESIGFTRLGPSSAQLEKIEEEILARGQQDRASEVTGIPEKPGDIVTDPGAAQAADSHPAGLLSEDPAGRAGPGQAGQLSTERPGKGDEVKGEGRKVAQDPDSNSAGAGARGASAERITDLAGTTKAVTRRIGSDPVLPALEPRRQSPALEKRQQPQKIENMNFDARLAARRRRKEWEKEKNSFFIPPQGLSFPQAQARRDFAKKWAFLEDPDKVRRSALPGQGLQRLVSAARAAREAKSDSALQLNYLKGKREELKTWQLIEKARTDREIAAAASAVEAAKRDLQKIEKAEKKLLADLPRDKVDLYVAKQEEKREKEKKELLDKEAREKQEEAEQLRKRQEEAAARPPKKVRPKTNNGPRNGG